MRSSLLPNRQTLSLSALVSLVAFTLYGLTLSSWLKWSSGPWDDAFMFIRYGHHLLEGHGPVWNVGDPPTYGFTSVLYQLLITTALFFFPLSPDHLLTAVGLVLSLTSLLSLVWVAHSHLHTPLIKHPLTLFSLILTALLSSDLFIRHSTTGMDTLLAILCHTWLIHFSLRLRQNQAPTALFQAAVWGYLTFLARPDSGLYALFTPLLTLLFSHRSWRSALSYLLFFALLLSGDTLIKALLFGDPLPLPYYAKCTGLYRDYGGLWQLNPLPNLMGFLRGSLPLLALILLGSRRDSLKVTLPLLLPCLITIGLLFTVKQIMGHDSRFYIPSLPFLLLSALLTLDTLLMPSASPPSPPLFGGALLALLLLSLNPLVEKRLEQGYSRYILQAKPFEPPIGSKLFEGSPVPLIGWEASREHMERVIVQLPPGSCAALSEIGRVGAYGLHLTLIDLVGLNDNTLAHQGFSLNYLFSRQPDVIWLPHYHYRNIHKQISHALLNHSEYEFFPGAFDYGVALRRRAPSYSTTRAFFLEEWKQAYPTLSPPPSSP